MRTRKGLTLIEVILAFAIIGIIAVALLTIFNSGLKNILNAGKRTKAVFIQKELIDNKILEYENKTDGKIIISVTIPDIIINKEIKGSILVSDPNSDKKITTFVPNAK